MRSTHNTFSIDRSIVIDVLGTPVLEATLMTICDRVEFKSRGYSVDL